MSEQPMPDFSAVLRALREEAHLTQEDLAGRAGVSPRTISDLERGINQTARKATARLLADALGLSSAARQRFLEAASGLVPAGGVLTTWGRSPPMPPPADIRYSLPPDAAAFIGRNAEVDKITAALASAGSGGMVAIHAISGMPGVGKTALAVHVAHQLHKRFPDRQLFIDLHAHTPGQDPMPTEAALAALLTAVGMDARFQPEGIAARAALWRDRMAGQRALLVLDNAASSAQVAPLLPGSKGCLVLVTSRRHLGDLPGAVTPVPVDILPPSLAQEMFLQLAPGTSPGPAVAELVGLAGYLPLAISLLARVLARHPSWSLTDLTTETEASMLTLAAENDSVAAAVEISYKYLTPSHQQFFRALGRHPGPTVDVYAAAALTGTSRIDATRILDDLHREALLTEASHRRYRMHDLIRRYAQRRASAAPGPEGEQALERLLDYYQHTAALAGIRISRQTRTGPALASRRSAPSVEDVEHALAWTRAERANLLACLDHATRTGQDTRVIALTSALAPLFRHDGPWTDAVIRHTAAIQASRHLGDGLGEANALNDLGDVQGLGGDYPAADDALRQALSIYRDLGDRLGEANALSNLGDLRRHTGDPPAAAEVLEQALSIYRDVGDRLGSATALNTLGEVLGLKGDYPAAGEVLDQALSIHRDLGDRFGEATALNFLGLVRKATGDFAAAAQALEQALSIYRDLGDRFGEATALNFLGSVQGLAGDIEGSALAHEQALSIYRNLGSRLGEANVLNFRGDVLRAAGDFPAAAQAQAQAMSVYRDLGVRLGEANVLIDLGDVRHAAGDFLAAAQALERALSIYRDLGDRLGEADALTGLGRCAMAIGHPAEAEALQRQAQEILRR